MEEDINTTVCNNMPTRIQETLILIVRSCVGVVGLGTCILTITIAFCLRLHRHFVYRLAMYKVTSSLMVNFFDFSFTSSS